MDGQQNSFLDEKIDKKKQRLRSNFIVLHGAPETKGENTSNVVISTFK